MSTSHKTIVKNLLDDMQEGRLANLWDYMTDDYEVALETSIIRGFTRENKNGKVIVGEVSPEGPALNKLQMGDEIVSVHEVGQIYDTFEDIRFGPWCLNPSEPAHIKVLRSGEMLEVDITPVITKFGRLPYTKEMWKEAYEETKEQWHEIHYEVEYLIEEGDQVACILSCTGLSKKYQRPFAYSQAYVFEFRDDKVARIFEVHNTVVDCEQNGYRIIPPEEWPLHASK